jgi:hypothetical protein
MRLMYTKVMRDTAEQLVSIQQIQLVMANTFLSLLNDHTEEKRGCPYKLLMKMLWM